MHDLSFLPGVTALQLFTCELSIINGIFLFSLNCAVTIKYGCGGYPGEAWRERPGESGLECLSYYVAGVQMPGGSLR